MQTFARRAMVGLKELQLPLGPLVFTRSSGRHHQAMTLSLPGQGVTENPRVESCHGGTLNLHADRSCAAGESPFPA
jgi:hypothetical protein